MSELGNVHVHCARAQVAHTILPHLLIQFFTRDHAAWICCKKLEYPVLSLAYRDGLPTSQYSERFGIHLKITKVEASTHGPCRVGAAKHRMDAGQ